jgi:EmrB/QacA subfamily drug resistance transporter
MKRRLDRTAMVPLVVACALFMQNLDSTVIATALPAIARSLHEDPLRLNLAITSYLLSLAVFIPLSGWMADRFGARGVFRSAVMVFTFGSILCALAQSLPELVGARIVQGCGGAMMVPVGRLVMLRVVPRSQLMAAMAFLTMPALIGPVVGPPLGGFIVTYASWRWIFLINLPIGILGIVLVTLLVEKGGAEQRRPLDITGFVLTAVGLVGLMFGFDTLGRAAMPGWVNATLLGAGAICTGLYILHCRRHPNPIVALGLLRIPTFKSATLGGFLFRIGVGASAFLLPMMLQIGFGLTPFASGMLTFASAAGALTMKMVATPIVRTIGFRRTMLGTTVINSIALAGYGLFSPTTPHLLIVAVLLVTGFFRSLQFTSIAALNYADVSQPEMSHATSMSSMMQQLSLSVGVGAAALALHFAVVAHGGTALTTAEFPPAFVAVALVSFTSIGFFLPLTADSGAEVVGRRSASADRSP